MLDERIADRWLSIAASEEALLSRLLELLQSDQRAVAEARADDVAENVLRKETVLCETGLLEEARKGLAASLSAPQASLPFADLPRFFPVSRAAVAGYGEDGAHRASAPTGRIVRQNVL